MISKLIIVSTSPSGRVAQRIKDVAIRAGYATVVYGLDQAPQITQDELKNAVVLPRIAPEYTTRAIPELERLVHMGGRVINNSQPWAISRNKWKSYRLFESKGVPTPKSLQYPESSYDECVRELGSALLFKPVDGTHGEGIVIVHSAADLRGKVGIVQQYIQESAGVDVRVFVVGSEVVGAMTRVAGAGEFRANLHQGASGTPITVDASTRKIAVNAAHALGLDVAGVDIVMSSEGAMVLEANPSPGLGIEAYTGPIIVPKMIATIMKMAA